MNYQIRSHSTVCRWKEGWDSRVILHSISGNLRELLNWTRSITFLYIVHGNWHLSWGCAIIHTYLNYRRRSSNLLPSSSSGCSCCSRPISPIEIPTYWLWVLLCTATVIQLTKEPASQTTGDHRWTDTEKMVMVVATRTEWTTKMYIV